MPHTRQRRDACISLHTVKEGRRGFRRRMLKWACLIGDQRVYFRGRLNRRAYGTALTAAIRNGLGRGSSSSLVF